MIAEVRPDENGHMARSPGVRHSACALCGLILPAKSKCPGTVQVSLRETAAPAFSALPPNLRQAHAALVKAAAAFMEAAGPLLESFSRTMDEETEQALARTLPKAQPPAPGQLAGVDLAIPGNKEK